MSRVAAALADMGLRYNPADWPLYEHREDGRVSLIGRVGVMRWRIGMAKTRLEALEDRRADWANKPYPFMTAWFDDLAASLLVAIDDAEAWEARHGRSQLVSGHGVSRRSLTGAS